MEGIESSFSNKNPKNFNKNVISFTRDKNFAINRPHKEFSKSFISFDGRKLTNNHKIEPHNFFHYYDDRISSKNDPNFEAEEALILNNGQNLENIISYINYINVSSFDDFIQGDIYNEKYEGSSETGHLLLIYEELSDNIPPNEIELEKSKDIFHSFLKELYNSIIDYLKTKTIVKIKQ